MKSVLIIENILNNSCFVFREVCSNFAEYILRDFKYTLLKHVMLKTPIPVKFLLVALVPFCKDEGGRRNKTISRKQQKLLCQLVFLAFCILCQTSAKLVRVF